VSNSALVSFTLLSPNCSARWAKIDTITIHHMAGDLTVEACGAGFSKPARKASANYGIGTDGRVGLYVPESEQAWTTGSRANDQRAVTIEVANCGGAPDWPVSEKAYESLIQLCADICRRNGIRRLNYTGDKTGNLTMHRWFQPTLCPGPYLAARFPELAAEVNERLEEEAMTGKEIFDKLNEYLAGQEAPAWAKAELDEAVAAGITDGTKPMTLIPRYQAALMALRAQKGAQK